MNINMENPFLLISADSELIVMKYTHNLNYRCVMDEFLARVHHKRTLDEYKTYIVHWRDIDDILGNYGYCELI